MQKITPHLWFDRQAIEAANFYASVFPESGISYTAKIRDTPSGDCDIVAFTVMGMEFQAISAGPVFQINPSISMMVSFDPSKNPDAQKSLDEIWAKLSEGGKALMPLDAYPFSKRYGWIQDKFGFTWQLMLANPGGEERPAIIPSLLFTKGAYGKAEEASDYYLSVFKDSKRGTIARYPAGMEPNKEGTVMFTDIELDGQWFAAMDGAGEYAFTFGEGVSLVIHCDSQQEIDYYTDKLSHVKESEQCGWVKDKFGVSWQIVPRIMDEVMASGDQAKIDRVVKVMMPMHKLDIAELTKAAEGK